MGGRRFFQGWWCPGGIINLLLLLRSGKKNRRRRHWREGFLLGPSVGARDVEEGRGEVEAEDRTSDGADGGTDGLSKSCEQLEKELELTSAEMRGDLTFATAREAATSVVAAARAARCSDRFARAEASLLAGTGTACEKMTEKHSNLTTEATAAAAALAAASPGLISRTVAL